MNLFLWFLDDVNSNGGDTLFYHVEALRGTKGKVEDSAGNKGPPVIDLQLQ